MIEQCKTHEPGLTFRSGTCGLGEMLQSRRSVNNHGDEARGHRLDEGLSFAGTSQHALLRGVDGGRLRAQLLHATPLGGVRDCKRPEKYT